MSSEHSYQLKDFPHIPCIHCSSTCITNIARFDGFSLSEPMAFGLGEGLGFVFYQDSAISPASRFNGRTSNFEEKFYHRIGSPITWHGSWSPSAIKESLLQGRPILAKTSLAELPYYEPADFFGHGILVIGIDEASQQIDVVDSISEDIQHISMEQFHHAISPHKLPLMKSYSYASAPKIQFELNKAMIRDSIIATMNTLVATNRPLEGFPAMETAINELPSWKALDDWKWHARFAYQSLEKRGTGGGNFRIMYADFLAEATGFIPKIADLKLVKNMKELASEWECLADIFKDTFLDEKPQNFIIAAKQLKHIKQLETAFCSTTLKNI